MTKEFNNIKEIDESIDLMRLEAEWWEKHQRELQWDKKWEEHQKELQRDKRIRTIRIIIWSLVFIFSCVIMPFIIVNDSYNREHHVGEYSCIYCNSKKTEGFNTFWYNDGTLCNGSYKYNLQNADFTFINCKNCGKDFKLYKKDWRSKN